MTSSGICGLAPIFGEPKAQIGILESLDGGELER